MTRSAFSKQRRATLPTRLPTALCVAAFMSCLSTHAYAEAPATPSRSGDPRGVGQDAADLEKAFWTCDYAATTSGVGLEEGAMCGSIFEDLKRAKFGGDFRAMLSWWQRSKTIEHQRLAAGSLAVSAPTVDRNSR